jgi:hypothetical protein
LGFARWDGGVEGIVCFGVEATDHPALTQAEIDLAEVVLIAGATRFAAARGGDLTNCQLQIALIQHLGCGQRHAQAKHGWKVGGERRQALDQ